METIKDVKYDFSKYGFDDICDELFGLIQETSALPEQDQKKVEALKQRFFQL